LVIRCSKFRKSRLVPLHETTQAGLEQYLLRRRAYTPLDDHVFVSLRRRPLLLHDAEPHFTTSSRRSASLVERGFLAPQSIPFATHSQ
jgi:integrase